MIIQANFKSGFKFAQVLVLEVFPSYFFSKMYKVQVLGSSRNLARLMYFQVLMQQYLLLH